MPLRPELLVIGYEDRLVDDHRALLAAAEIEGFAAELVDPSRVAVDVSAGGAVVLVDGAPRTPAVALPRGLNRPWPFIRQVLEVWAAFGTRVVPGVMAADLCADKLATARVLADRGVPVLTTLGVLPGAGASLAAADDTDDTDDTDDGGACAAGELISTNMC